MHSASWSRCIEYSDRRRDVTAIAQKIINAKLNIKWPEALTLLGGQPSEEGQARCLPLSFRRSWRIL